MSNLSKESRGSTLTAVFLSVVVVAAVTAAGLYVYRTHHKSVSDRSAATHAPSPSTAKSTPATNQQPAQPTTSAPLRTYLVVRELGIRLTLSDSIKDAYYVVTTNTAHGKPIVALYLRSLDRYPLCAPGAKGGPGVAAISNYVDGETDPIAGDYGKTYPDAPLIQGVHYFIEHAQFNCAANDGHPDMAAIWNAFTDAYSSIEPYTGE